MKTRPIYLEDPYKKELEAKVVELKEQSDGNLEVILDATIFYPFGGGQPSDQGELAKGLDKANVLEVRLSGNEIRHIVKGGLNLNIGDTVTCILDWNRRYKNMKVHSAGHVIDFALIDMGVSPSKLTPLKGSHGSKAHIIYKGELDAEIKENLQSKVNGILADDLEFLWEFVDYKTLEANASYLQPGLPTNKPLRMLTLKSIGSVADGGTIVRKTSEIDGIEIINITNNGEEVKIDYRVVDSKERTSKEKVVKTREITDANFIGIVNDAKKFVQEAVSESELTELWREYLGKNGKIKDLMSKIAEIEPEKRKEYGQQLNSLREAVDEIINSAKHELLSGKNKNYLQESQGDLSFEKIKVGHKHPLTQTINEINRIFIKLGYSVYDGPEIETDEYLFQKCNLPVDHPARDLQDSIFIEEPNILLRTQTSSVEARALEELEPPFKIVVPGRVYRNEKVNKSNHFLFHQYQLVCVQEKVSMTELFATVRQMFNELYGEDVQIRFRTKYYPEVEPGAGVDMLCPFCKGDGCSVCKMRGWLEMAGSGIIHPNMLKMAGLNPDEWQGFAFGFGLDRLAMTKHNIQDIRTLLGGNLAYKPHLGTVN